MIETIDKGYFEEQFSSGQSWLSTDLKFHLPPSPFYRVYTGGKHGRFMLATPTFRCHWGVHLPYLEGVHILRNPIDIDQNNMPITSISSADIEQFKRRSPDNLLQYWARFFADKLLHSSTHFLYSSEWKIASMATQDGSQWPYFEESILSRDMQSLDYHFDWGGFPTDGLIPLKSLPDEHSGRVKWWRKKIHEQCCPPLLLWWQPHIQAFVLVDGHARLKAYQLEQVQPCCLSIVSFQYIHCGYAVDHPERIKERLKIFSGIKASLDKGHGPPSIESLNSIMLSLYDNYNYDHLTLTPKVINHLDEVIEQDLCALIKDKKVDQKTSHLLLSYAKS